MEKCLNIEHITDNQKLLNSEWRVYIHGTTDSNWEDNSFKEVFLINSLESYKKFILFFSEYDTVNNYIYIMRNRIMPRWEHNENIKGGKYTAILHNLTNKDTNLLFGIEVFVLLSYMIINETISDNSEIINGISYVIKNNFTNIQIWWKDYQTNHTKNIVDQEIINEVNKKYIEINKGYKQIKYDLFKVSEILHS
jgi:hypothetical protein